MTGVQTCALPIYQILTIENPAKFPNNGDISEIWEPYVEATIICPVDYLGALMELCQKRRGKQINMKYLNTKIVVLKYQLPLAEIIVGFYDALKSVSKGLVRDLRPGTPAFLIDPKEVNLPGGLNFTVIRDGAGQGMERLREKLLSLNVE